MSEALASESNFIVIGAWNASIIEPKWLKDNFPNIIRSREFGININIGSGSSISYKIDDITLDASNGRLTFAPRELNEENLRYIENLASGIYKRLSHTPIVASGCNFLFQLSPNEVFVYNNVEEHDKLKDFYNEREIIGFTGNEVRHKFSYENHVLTVIYKIDGDVKTIKYNFEYNGAQNLLNAAGSILENYNRSLAYNERLIGVL